MLEGVIAQADAITDIGARIEHLVKGVFSGNIFDLGAAQVLAVIVMTKEMRFCFLHLGSTLECEHLIQLLDNELVSLKVLQSKWQSTLIIQQDSDICIN